MLPRVAATPPTPTREPEALIDGRSMVDRARGGAVPHFDRNALLALAPAPPVYRPYSRRVLYHDDLGEVMLARWRQGSECAAHDHGGSCGVVVVLAGTVRETVYAWDPAAGLLVESSHTHGEGALIVVPQARIHAMAASTDAVTLHVYGPSPAQVRLHDLEHRRSYVVAADHGAWLPVAQKHVLATEPWHDVASRRARPVLLVVYTTHYREGSSAFARSAQTLADQLQAEHPRAEVWLRPIQWKAEFVQLLASLTDDARTVAQLHFVGHSGMYGPMFGSVAWPQQLSPHEWRRLSIPFGKDAQAVFHACRTGRWFAGFFARTFAVTAQGYHGYTTVSRAPDRFVWDRPLGRAGRALHVIACPGRKSHGLLGSIAKHLGLARAESLKRFEPTPADEAPSYDRVAPAYSEAFCDLRVRGPELRFVRRALAPLAAQGPLHVLDIGCGNGALFDALRPQIGTGVGVDLSRAMIDQARAAHRHLPQLRFERISGPTLPFADGSFDAVISFLSFRYLDWDPALQEIQRVLRPGGRFIVVDMVAKPLGLTEAPLLVRSSLAHLQTRLRHRDFVDRLQRLTRSPQWQQMLEHNPIRAEHEYRWYLESRFPKRTLETISASRTARIVAFDSGPKDDSWRLSAMAYP